MAMQTIDRVEQRVPSAGITSLTWRGVDQTKFAPFETGLLSQIDMAAF